MSGKLILKHHRFMSKQETQQSCYFNRIKGEAMGISHRISQLLRGRSFLFLLISQLQLPLSFPTG